MQAVLLGPSQAPVTLQASCSSHQLRACWNRVKLRTNGRLPAGSRSTFFGSGAACLHLSGEARVGARLLIRERSPIAVGSPQTTAALKGPAWGAAGPSRNGLQEGHVAGLGSSGQLPIRARQRSRGTEVGSSNRGAAAAAAETPVAPPPRKNFFSVLLVAVRSLWKQVTLPLSNFGFGKRSIWEGGVGLFLLAGAVMLALLWSWINAAQVRSRTSRYQAVFEFSQACGIAVGTPVRIRGVPIGQIVGVRPSLERIDAVAEIMDSKVVIPRNSLVEVNQSGLISETLIDITPRNPIPAPTVDPLHPLCEEEGVIVCDRQRIVGHQGVSLDELVGICTKLAKQMDEEGVRNIFKSVDKVTATVEDAKPLLDKVTQITSDLQPLMKELSEGELLKNLEGLTKVATEAATDLRQLNSSVLTADNTQLLRDSVSTLTKTLKHIESISADVSILTGDAGTRYNLKQLIESLSRLVND